MGCLAKNQHKRGERMTHNEQERFFPELFHSKKHASKWEHNFTRLRQDAPCGSTGMNGDRRPRRSP